MEMCLFLGSGSLPMTLARRAILVSLVESFGRAIGAEIRPFLLLEDPECLKELLARTADPEIWLSGISRLLKGDRGICSHTLDR